MRKTLLCTFES